MNDHDFAKAGLERLDDRPMDLRPHELLTFSCVRDEVLRLPYFLDYHRQLGVDRFFVVDNASTDGTTQLLLEHQDVHVFAARGSYASSNCGVAWLNALLGTFAPGHWTLTVDVDELLVYPHCETISLHALTRYLDAHGADALTTFLLDMYADRPIEDTIYVPGTPFLETCAYFDSDTYHQRDAHGLPKRGGPRYRLFWEGRERSNPAPVLSKTPLVKWRPDLRYEASTHRIAGLTASKITGVLLHFKLFSDFFPNVAREVERGEHWNSAIQYACYLDVLHNHAGLSAYSPSSRRYESSLQLMALGLIRVPSGFAGFGDEPECSPGWSREPGGTTRNGGGPR